MNAITLDEAGTSPALRSDLPAPTPGPREALVRVQASSVNPVDNSIAAGMLAQMGVEYEYPVTLGRDYAGVVEQVGDDVTDYAPGDEVFGFLLHANPTARDGSWTTHHRLHRRLHRPPADERRRRGRRCRAAGGHRRSDRRRRARPLAA